MLVPYGSTHLCMVRPQARVGYSGYTYAKVQFSRRFKYHNIIYCSVIVFK